MKLDFLGASFVQMYKSGSCLELVCMHLKVTKSWADTSHKVKHFLSNNRAYLAQQWMFIRLLKKSTILPLLCMDQMRQVN